MRMVFSGSEGRHGQAGTPCKHIDETAFAYVTPADESKFRLVCLRALRNITAACYKYCALDIHLEGLGINCYAAFRQTKNKKLRFFFWVFSQLAVSLDKIRGVSADQKQKAALLFLGFLSTCSIFEFV
jgi:hypothetical protein